MVWYHVRMVIARWMMVGQCCRVYVGVWWVVNPGSLSCVGPYLWEWGGWWLCVGNNLILKRGGPEFIYIF